MFDRFPKFMRDHHLYVAILAIIYILSEISGQTETVWQVVVIVATYIGGSSMKEFAVDVLATLRKLDAILEQAGIQWEDVLRDAIENVKGGKSG